MIRVHPRLTFSLLSIAACLFLIQAAARFGFARLLSRSALVTNSISAAQSAIDISPSDPEAHRTRAAILNRQQMPAEAVKSLESAASLRYRDDYLWIDLANTREELGNSAGALAALDQAVRWAPYYAHTHWQRGNLLLRMGRPVEAFDDLRKAAATNRSYLPNIIDLAWRYSRGDLESTETLIEINDDDERNVLIRYLIAAKAFREAFELSHRSDPHGELLNGGFEDPLVLNSTGFGWRVSPEQNKNRLAIDVSEKFEGSKSLQINLAGNWTPGTSLLSQTFIVESGTTYRVYFRVKTKDLVTGGPPLIVVTDANNNQLLGKSENLPTASSGWVTLNFDFTALPTSQAAVISLQRNNCDSSPCPIFGTMWLDWFQIGQTKPAITR
jgi:tetratricopeptide (TPR) repeat protein